MGNQTIRMKKLREKYFKNILNNQFLEVKKQSFRVRKRFYGTER